ncbi:hypothetical protein K439DRAFT_1641175 [Ramaria rubella]|nr:hypothetical protein K439DRAFT_1641175 [Ramaria rubella]
MVHAPQENTGKSFDGNLALLKRSNSLKLSLIRHNDGSPLHALCFRPHQYLMSPVGRRVECEYRTEHHAIWMPVTVHPQGEIPHLANISSHEQTRLKPCRGVYIQDVAGTKATMVWEQFHLQEIKVRFVHGQHSEILRRISSRVTEGASSSSYL